MLTRLELGRLYEQKAYDILLQQKLTFIAKNSHSRLGEIDLIMREKECIVFIEVRYRKNSFYGDASSTINRTKQTKIIHAAFDWMNKNSIDIEECEFRFDVFAFNGEHYQWIKNAFSFKIANS